MPAYTTSRQLEIAAGGPDKLVQLADLDNDGTADVDVLAQAQGDADTWINGYAFRLHEVPFDPIPKAIASLAAAETVYRLRQNRSMIGDKDIEMRKERETTLDLLAAGKWNPVDDDDYPIGDDSATPYVAEITADPDSATGDFGRRGTRGFW